MGGPLRGLYGNSSLAGTRRKPASPSPHSSERGEGTARSSALAWSHRRSISASVDCAGVRPCAASSSSMRRKRRMNFWFAARRAPSGSIFRCLATLATTNSRSPNSSAIFALWASAATACSRSPAAMACSSSASSSFSLSNTGASEGQSNPTLAALSCNLTARVRAGRAGGTSSRTPPCLRRSFLGLDALPEARGGAGGALGVAAEDVRVAADHFLRDGVHHIGEGEGAVLLGHARVIDNLKQQIAQLVLERAHVALLDGVGDLVGFLDGVGGNRLESLLQVPRTARARRAQGRHHGQKIGNRLARVRAHCGFARGHDHGGLIARNRKTRTLRFANRDAAGHRHDCHRSSRAGGGVPARLGSGRAERQQGLDRGSAAGSMCADRRRCLSRCARGWSGWPAAASPARA